MVSALGSPSAADVTSVPEKRVLPLGLLGLHFTSTKADGVLSAQFFYVGVASVYAR